MLSHGRVSITLPNILNPFLTIFTTSSYIKPSRLSIRTGFLWYFLILYFECSKSLIGFVATFIKYTLQFVDIREGFRQKHGIRKTGSSTFDRFYSRVFCAACGGKFIRKYWKGIYKAFWRCEHSEKRGGHSCTAGIVREDTLRSAVVIAWNSMVTVCS